MEPIITKPRQGPANPAGTFGGAVLVLLCLVVAPGDVPAAPNSPVWQDMAALGRLAEQYVVQNVGDTGGRLQVSAVPPDERLRLAACAMPIAETAEGQRLWGWTQVRVRCPGDPAWSLSVRVRVQIFVPALLTRRALPAGHLIEPADIVRSEVDLTGIQRPALRDDALVIGRVARVGLAAGQAIGAEHLRSPVLVRRGAALEVIATVGQVSVTSAGTALQDGAIGEMIRVKMQGGRTVQGIVTADGRVEVQMPPP